MQQLLWWTTAALRQCSIMHCTRGVVSVRAAQVTSQLVLGQGHGSCCMNSGRSEQMSEAMQKDEAGQRLLVCSHCPHILTLLPTESVHS